MSHRHHGLLPFNGLEHLCELGEFRAGRFARLFTDLPPLYIDPLVLHDLGSKGGPMEDKGKPNLTKATPLGLIFFGQFIDHDITLDDSSSLTVTNDPSSIENVRTPTLDLDNVYGDGPGAHPFLFDGNKLLTGADYADPNDPGDLLNHDLPRAANGTAIIGDPRNDEHRVISQLQLGFLRFHNAVVDELASKPNAPSGSELFEQARRVVTWHYHWVVINDFLRAICGDWIVDDILANGRRVYRPEEKGNHEPFIPIEFATGAYRFGHSMIPQKFRVQPGGDPHDIFGPTLGSGFEPLDNLDAVVEWDALLDSGNGQYERASQLDILLAEGLLALPFIPPSVPAFERSLAVRNLLRAQSFLAPSGEQVARAMIAAGAEEITEDMIREVRDEVEDDLGLPKASPLWIYLLAEGREIGRMDGVQSFSKGEGLGPVGARFVAEVLLGLLELDTRSFLGSNRSWSPETSEDKLGNDGVKTLYELLTFAAGS